MSLFRVLKNGVGMMGTDNESCIDFHYLDSQENAGYTFEVNGKKMTAKQVKKYFGYDEKSVSNNKNEVSHVCEHKKSNRGRKIKCIQNNKTYSNMSECARDLKIDPATVSYSLQVNRCTKSGYSFEFID